MRPLQFRVGHSDSVGEPDTISSSSSVGFSLADWRLGGGRWIAGIAVEWCEGTFCNSCKTDSLCEIISRGEISIHVPPKVGIPNNTTKTDPWSAWWMITGFATLSSSWQMLFHYSKRFVVCFRIESNVAFKDSTQITLRLNFDRHIRNQASCRCSLSCVAV